jgi:hypothetical protein
MDAIFLRYMAAWVRLNAMGNTGAWSAGDVRDCFALLPPPPASFEQWKALLGVSQEAPPVAEMTDEDRKQANVIGLSLLRAEEKVMPDVVKQVG